MKHTVTFLLLLLTTLANGQEELFNKIYSKSNFDYGDAVIERHDGKYLIAGSSRSQFETDYDVNILLVDSVGNLILDKYIGQSPRMEFAYSLIETKDSNYVVSGRVNGSNPYLMKFNSSGNLIWEKEYPSAHWTEGFSVGQTFDSGYFFVRPDTSTTLFVTNPIGDTLWTRRYNSVICHSVIQTADSGFALTGNINPNTSNQDIILIKTNPVGDTLWTKTFGGVGSDDANSVQQLSDNGYLIAGNFDAQISDGDMETFIIRTNSFGDTLWTQKYDLGIAHYIKECTNNNGYILSTIRYVPGWFPSSDKYYIVITKLDPLGNIEWSRQFDGYTYSLGNNVTQTSDGGYLLTGFVENSTSESDILLIKLDSMGNYVLSVGDISNSNNSQVLVFPNPTTDEVNFVVGSNSGKMINQIQIFNLIGQEIKYSTGLSETQFKINVTDFPTGLYIYKLTTSDKQIVSGKFIVRE